MLKKGSTRWSESSVMKLNAFALKESSLITRGLHRMAQQLPQIIRGVVLIDLVDGFDTDESQAGAGDGLRHVSMTT